SRTELAADELVVALELAEQLLDVTSEVVVRLPGGERPAALREPVHELLQRRRGLRRLEERVGQPARRHHPERVAIASGVLRRDQPLFARHPRAERAPLSNERLGEARVVLALAQVAAAAQY